MISLSFANELLNILAEADAQFFEIFAEKTISNNIFLDNQKIEKISTGVDAGVGIRLIKGQSTAYAFVNSFDKKLLQQTAKECGNVFRSKKPKKDIILSPLTVLEHSHIKILPQTIDLDKKVFVLNQLDRTARSFSGLINQVTAQYSDIEQKVLIANSKGLATEDMRIHSRFMINVIAQKNGIIQTGYESPGEARGWEHMQEQNIESTSLSAARRAVKMLSAKPLPAGKMMVVLSGEAGGTMIHEACGHFLEADFIHRKTSIFTDSLDKQIASPLITVVDDGSLAYQYGFMNIDDEGTKTRKNILIENGILKAFMTDRLNASLLGIPLTGNGRRESYRNKPMPRMTNTYIAPRDSAPADILASVEEGLFVVKMQGGQVNTTNGDFVFKISEGYLIKKGKIEEPVRGATLTGNGPEILRGIDMVGNDISFMPGICGKEDDVPVSHGQPTIRIPEILVGGHT